MHHMSVALIAGEHTGLTDFEFGLDVLLDGLARLAARESARPSSRPPWWRPTNPRNPLN
jgi:hypothetical protein